MTEEEKKDKQKEYQRRFREKNPNYGNEYYHKNQEERNEKLRIYRAGKRTGKKYKKTTFLEYIIKLLNEDKQMNH